MHKFSLTFLSSLKMRYNSSMGSALNLVYVVVSLMFAYFLATPIQNFYCSNVGTCTNGFFGLDLSVLIWMALIYVFLAPIFLAALGGKQKKWWIVGSIAPVLIFQVIIDVYHLYLPIIFALVAYGVGTLAHKALTKYAPGFISKIS